jgi:hypothetical protein
MHETQDLTIAQAIRPCKDQDTGCLLSVSETDRNGCVDILSFDELPEGKAPDIRLGIQWGPHEYALFSRGFIASRLVGFGQIAQLVECRHARYRFQFGHDLCFANERQTNLMAANEPLDFVDNPMGRDFRRIRFEDFVYQLD